ncbi:Ribose-phosphate pyrophosphokinase [Candidatus Vidania fulgoroideae]|nr:Ribose-phosphate pyrophosphokinase [Candidatus Vidania fulgoroideae]
MFFCGNNCEHICKDVSKLLKVSYKKINVEKFPDGEINVYFKGNLNNEDIFFFKNLFKPINENIMEAFMAIRNFKKHNSGKVFLISPYLGYSRNDRENEYNIFNCVSSKLLADLLETSGLDGLFTVDLHTKQISSFYKIPVTNIDTFPITKKLIKKKQILFPDFGSLKRFGNLVEYRDYNYSVIHKYRKKNKIKSFGKKKKKEIIFIDDIIDTGKTLIKSLKKVGKKKTVYSTHAVFSTPVKKILRKAKIKFLYTTNTIKTKNSKHVRVKNISKLIFNKIKEYVQP